DSPAFLGAKDFKPNSVSSTERGILTMSSDILDIPSFVETQAMSLDELRAHARKFHRAYQTLLGQSAVQASSIEGLHREIETLGTQLFDSAESSSMAMMPPKTDVVQNENSRLKLELANVQDELKKTMSKVKTLEDGNEQVRQAVDDMAKIEANLRRIIDPSIEMSALLVGELGGKGKSPLALKTSSIGTTADVVSAQPLLSDPVVGPASTVPVPTMIPAEGETLFLDVAFGLGHGSGDSLRNVTNAEVICQTVRSLNDSGEIAADLVVLCFTRAQAKMVRQKIVNSEDGTRGCRKICVLEDFVGQQSKVVILDFVAAESIPNFHILDKFHLKKPQTSAEDYAMYPKVRAEMRDVHRLAFALCRAMRGLYIVGQLALFVGWVFGRREASNTLFRLAENYYERGIIVPCHQVVDQGALPERQKPGPWTTAELDQLKEDLDVFVREKLRQGRQLLGPPPI
ncbi:MAG: hypothetical protein Q9224_006846, partial [Gallowayella concinna]